MSNIRDIFMSKRSTPIRVLQRTNAVEPGRCMVVVVS